MKPKIAAFDLDGTLTNSKKIITPKTLQALNMLQQQNVRIVLASGRPYYGIKPLAALLQLDKYGGYVLSYNGGKITECSTESTLYTNEFPLHFAQKIISIAKEFHLLLLTYDHNYIITENASNPYVIEEQYINQMDITEVNSLSASLKGPVNKFLIVGNHNELEQIKPVLDKHLKPYADTCFSAPFFLEVMPKGIDKALSLNYLLKHLQLNPSDLIAFGDGMNDLAMLQYAKIGVAMGNACPSLLKAADFITKSNDEDGIPYAIGHFF